MAGAPSSSMGLGGKHTPKGKSVGHYVKRGLFWLLIVFILVYTIFPFYWSIATAVKPDSEIASTPVVYWPKEISWTHFEYVFDNGDFLKALRNSAIVSAATVLLALAIGSVGAYALGRMRFRGRTFTLYLILSMTMFPAIAILGSLFRMIRGDWFIPTPNIYNSWWALIVTYLTFTLPFTVWVLTNFFKAMPGELEEAALVDGASAMRTFWEILLPLALPGLVTTGLLAFIAAWNEFLFALTFTQDFDARTAPVAIASFSGNTQYDYPFGTIMAASVIVTLPLVVLVLIFQRKILGGLTAGAVKG
ncbi:MAG: carbohydrate ABC transporter permease [Thermomicrobiales bacterium]|nr:carbohydrate ABC transporter permease [Thermomicrobiales bacterium]